VSKAVLNSSVIIALSVLSHLNKLKHLFKETLLSRAVYDEICVTGCGLIGDAELSEAVEKGVIKIKDVKNRTLVNALIDPLGRGEAETIALTVEEKAEYIVMDDRLARRRAKNLGLKVIGTLRILKMMLNNGLIDKKKFLNAIEKLRETGFRISNKLINKVKKEL
jgi:predicted nucleic acid-binding protein